MQLALLKCSDKAKEVRRLGLVLLATLALPAVPEEVTPFIARPHIDLHRPGAAPRAAPLAPHPCSAAGLYPPLIPAAHTATMLPPYQPGAGAAAAGGDAAGRVRRA